MKLKNVVSKIASLFLAAFLTLVDPAFALRTEQSVDSGLEEEIVRSLGGPLEPSAGLEEVEEQKLIGFLSEMNRIAAERDWSASLEDPPQLFGELVDKDPKLSREAVRILNETVESVYRVLHSELPDDRDTQMYLRMIQAVAARYLMSTGQFTESAALAFSKDPLSLQGDVWYRQWKIWLERAESADGNGHPLKTTEWVPRATHHHVALLLLLLTSSRKQFLDPKDLNDALKVFSEELHHQLEMEPRHVKRPTVELGTVVKQIRELLRQIKVPPEVKKAILMDNAPTVIELTAIVGQISGKVAHQLGYHAWADDFARTSKEIYAGLLKGHPDYVPWQPYPPAAGLEEGTLSGFSPEEEELLRKFGLTTRTLSALRDAGITSIEELDNEPLGELRLLRGGGKVGFRQIKKARDLIRARLRQSVTPGVKAKPFELIARYESFMARAGSSVKWLERKGVPRTLEAVRGMLDEERFDRDGALVELRRIRGLLQEYGGTIPGMDTPQRFLSEAIEVLSAAGLEEGLTVDEAVEKIRQGVEQGQTKVVVVIPIGHAAPEGKIFDFKQGDPAELFKQNFYELREWVSRTAGVSPQGLVELSVSGSLLSIIPFPIPLPPLPEVAPGSRKIQLNQGILNGRVVQEIGPYPSKDFDTAIEKFRNRITAIGYYSLRSLRGEPLSFESARWASLDQFNDDLDSAIAALVLVERTVSALGERILTGRSFRGEAELVEYQISPDAPKGLMLVFLIAEPTAGLEEESESIGSWKVDQLPGVMESHIWIEIDRISSGVIRTTSVEDLIPKEAVKVVVNNLEEESTPAKFLYFSRYQAIPSSWPGQLAWLLSEIGVRQGVVPGNQWKITKQVSTEDDGETLVLSFDLRPSYDAAGLEEASRKRAEVILKQVRAKPPEKVWPSPAQRGLREKIREVLATALEKEKVWRRNWRSSPTSWSVAYPLAAKLARHLDPSGWDSDASLQKAFVNLVMEEIHELRQEPLSLSWTQVSWILPQKSSKEVRALFNSLSEKLPQATPAMLRQLLLDKDPLLKAQQLSDRWLPEPPVHGQSSTAGLEEGLTVGNVLERLRGLEPRLYSIEIYEKLQNGQEKLLDQLIEGQIPGKISLVDRFDVFVAVHPQWGSPQQGTVSFDFIPLSSPGDPHQRVKIIGYSAAGLEEADFPVFRKTHSTEGLLPILLTLILGKREADTSSTQTELELSSAQVKPKIPPVVRARINLLKRAHSLSESTFWVDRVKAILAEYRGFLDAAIVNPLWGQAVASAVEPTILISIKKDLAWVERQVSKDAEPEEIRSLLMRHRRLLSSSGMGEYAILGKTPYSRKARSYVNRALKAIPATGLEEQVDQIVQRIVQGEPVKGMVLKEVQRVITRLGKQEPGTAYTFADVWPVRMDSKGRYWVFLYGAWNGGVVPSKDQSERAIINTLAKNLFEMISAAWKASPLMFSGQDREKFKEVEAGAILNQAEGRILLILSPFDAQMLNKFLKFSTEIYKSHLARNPSSRYALQRKSLEGGSVFYVERYPSRLPPLPKSTPAAGLEEGFRRKIGELPDGRSLFLQGKEEKVGKYVQWKAGVFIGHRKVGRVLVSFGSEAGGDDTLEIVGVHIWKKDENPGGADPNQGFGIGTWVIQSLIQEGINRGLTRLFSIIRNPRSFRILYKGRLLEDATVIARENWPDVTPVPWDRFYVDRQVEKMPAKPESVFWVLSGRLGGPAAGLEEPHRIRLTPVQEKIAQQIPFRVMEAAHQQGLSREALILQRPHESVTFYEDPEYGFRWIRDTYPHSGPSGFSPEAHLDIVFEPDAWSEKEYGNLIPNSIRPLMGLSPVYHIQLPHYWPIHLFALQPTHEGELHLRIDSMRLSFEEATMTLADLVAKLVVPYHGESVEKLLDRLSESFSPETRALILHGLSRRKYLNSEQRERVENTFVQILGNELRPGKIPDPLILKMVVEGLKWIAFEPVPIRHALPMLDTLAGPDSLSPSDVRMMSGSVREILEARLAQIEQEPLGGTASPSAGLEERERAVARELAVAAWGAVPSRPASVGSQVLVITKSDLLDLVPLALLGGAVAVDYDGPETAGLEELLNQMKLTKSLGPYAIGKAATQRFLQEYEQPIRVTNRQDLLRRLGLDPNALPSGLEETLKITRDYLGSFV